MDIPLPDPQYTIPSQHLQPLIKMTTSIVAGMNLPVIGCIPPYHMSATTSQIATKQGGRWPVVRYDINFRLLVSVGGCW